MCSHFKEKTSDGQRSPSNRDNATGAIYVIEEHRGNIDITGSWRSLNVNNKLREYIQKSGMEPWKKPFHRMRGNFITDLLNDGYGIHTASAWSGTSPRIILEHYARVLPSDFARASVTLPRNELLSFLGNKELHQEKGVTKSVTQEGKRDAINATGNKKPLFSSTTRNGKQGRIGKTDGEGFDKDDVISNVSCSCDAIAKSHCAESCALLENTVLSSDDRQALKTIINLWPYLSPESKIEVMRTIEAITKADSLPGSLRLN